MSASSHDQPDLLDAIDAGVMRADEQGRLLYANAFALRWLGLPWEQLCGRSLFELCAGLVGPDGAPLGEAAHPARRALDRRAPVTEAVVGMPRAGGDEERWLMVNVRPELDAAGAVTGLLCCFTDITESRRTQRSAESLYRAVIRAMSEGVVIHDQDSSIRMANPAAERILGLSAAQLSGRTPLDPRWRLTLPDGRPVGPDDIPSEITRKTGRPCKEHLLGVHRSTGELAWLSVNTDPFGEPGPGGHPTVATFTDVTAERQAKLALERSQAHLSRILGAIPGVVYEYRRAADGREHFDFVSGRAADVLGVEADLLLRDASLVLRRIHPEDAAGFAESIAASAANLSVWERDFRLQGRDGTWRWVRAHSVPRAVEGGVCWTGVAMDVTAAHQLEEGLRRAQRREAMGDLAAGVAHNFNNMLAAIVPNLELAIADAPEPLRPLLQDAQQAARSATELVAQLLALGRQDAADEPGGADLLAVVGEATRICRRTFDRSIVLSAVVPAEPVPVRGRASELQQVVLNLLLNARDALRDRSEPRIELWLQGAAEGAGGGPGGWVELIVRDNGCGMDDGTLRRLGEPFFTTKSPGRGTGLGLATVYRSVAAAGGTVRVESAAGRGTTFTVRLPRFEGRGALVAQTVAAGTLPRGGRVLIVDDEELVRRGLARVLRRMGLETVEVGSGDEAVQCLPELLASPPGEGALCAVILDLSLPGLPGAEVLARVRALRPSLPVLVLSGHIESPERLSGVACVLQKPISSAALQRALEDVLGGSSPTGKRS